MDRRLRAAERPGISTAVAVVALILVVGAAAAGWTVLSLSQSSGSASTSSTSLTGPAQAASTGANSSASSAATVASSSASSIPCLLNGTGAADLAQLNSTLRALVGNLTGLYNQGPGNVTVTDLFGNFTQMAVTSNVIGTIPLSTSSSYQVIGRPMVGSLEYYEVAFTTDTSFLNESQTVMFAPNGTATSVSSPTLGNFTGASAQAMGEGDVSSFLIMLHSSVYAKAIQSDPSVAVLNSTTVSLGPTQVKMTYYTLKSPPPSYCGTTIKELIEGIGMVQKTGLTMLMYSQGQVTQQGVTVGTTTSLESLTLAGP